MPRKQADVIEQESTEQEPDEPESETSGDEPAGAEIPEEVADEVGQAIALREQTVPATSALPSVAEFNASMAVADRIAMSRVVPDSYRGRPDDVLAAILYGREIGLGPMTALRDIYMVDGRAAIAAHRQLGILRHGGIRILESGADAERAFITAQRTDTGEIMTVEFTMEEAAKITKKGGGHLVDGMNWRNYPKDMLWARCVGRLSRRLGPDLIGGLPPYTAEEVADFSGWGVEYGEEGLGLTSRPAKQVETRIRRDWNAPSNWADLGERFARQLGNEEWDEWRMQILREVYNVETVAAAATGDGGVTWRRFQSMLYELEEWPRPHEVAPIPRAVIQEAIAKSFDGAAIEGPSWRLSAEESDRPISPYLSPPSDDDDEDDPGDEAIEDAEIVEDVPAAAAPQVSAERNRTLEKIDKLLVDIDRKRGVPRGTTHVETITAFGERKDADDATLTLLAERLAGYYALGKHGMTAQTFFDFCADQQAIDF